MEEKSLGSGVGTEQSSAFEGPHGARRRHAYEVLSAQENYLDRLEAELAEQLQHLAEEVRQSVELSGAAAGEQGESAAVAALQTQLDTLKQQFSALDAQCDQLRQQNEQSSVEQARLEQELRVRDTLLKESQGHDEQRRVELASLREELADAQAQLGAARSRQAAAEQELESERERFESRQEETKSQRRRIAREFKQLRAEHLADLAERKAELQSLAHVHNHELEEKIKALEADLQLAAEEHAREIADMRSFRSSEVDSEALQELQAECDLLTRKLAQAEERLAEQASHGNVDANRDDLQRRFEMAVDEVRELKRANADLETKLKNRGGGNVASSAPGGGLDWEAQKERLLASLEADNGGDDEDDEVREERISAEATIRITDQIVAHKDEEIAALKQQLEELEASASDYQSDASQELLDQDETIRVEREKLVQMQAEWREKIGEAEIEISVQRAKLARERAEIDEKLRQLQTEMDARGPHDESQDPGGKPTRGRWLARLGLKDLDEGN